MKKITRPRVRAHAQPATTISGRINKTSKILSGKWMAEAKVNSAYERRKRDEGAPATNN